MTCLIQNICAYKKYRKMYTGRNLKKVKKNFAKLKSS